MKTIRSLYRFGGRCLISLLLCGQGFVFGNDYLKTEYSYRQYTMYDGLPNLTAGSIYQDEKGFIWIGTNNGFVRYDGQHFQKYVSDRDVSISHFIEKPNGDVCGGTYTVMYKVSSGNDSIHLVDLTEHKMFQKDKSRSLPKGYYIYRDTDESLAIYHVTDTSFTKVWEHKLLMAMRPSQGIYWDRVNQQFFVPTQKGTYVVGENGAVRDSFAITTISSFVPYRNGLSAIADDGIYEYTGKEFRSVLKYPFFTGIYQFYNALTDAAGRLVIHAENSIYRYDNGTLEVIADGIGQINDMLLDKEGNLWVATAAGVYNFFRLDFKSYTPVNKEDVVISVMHDSKNRIWAPTYRGELMRITDGKQETVHYPASPNGYKYFYFRSVADNDTLYITGGGGIYQYKNNQIRWVELPAQSYDYILPLSNGNILTGNEKKACLYNRNWEKMYEYTSEMLHQFVVCAATDNKGRIYIGGPQGVTTIDGDSVWLNKSDTLHACRLIVPDLTGKFWMVCQNRLVCMENNRIRMVHTFPNTLVRSVCFTRSGIMVVATLEAIYLSTDPLQPDFICYDQYNGYNGMQPLYNPMDEDKDGYVWMLTLGRMIRFKPDELIHKQPVPRIHLQSMQASADNIRWINIKDDRAELNYKNTNVKFIYIGLCYSATGNLRYQYRLVGFQDEWSPPMPEKEVTFNNLPPGHYEFQLKANTGTNDTETAVISQYFTIRPAFWQTWWFVAVVILLLMLASTGIALYIQRRKNDRLIERLETEKQLNELRVKSIRLRSIPHFNANVLAAIEYYVMNLSKDDANRLLNIYSEFTSQTLREVDKASRSLHDELDYVQLYLKLEKLRFMEKFNYEVDIDPEVKQDVQLPNMILHTYCENAVKHGFSGRTSGCRLKISARQKADVVEVCVEDNGVGRAAAAQNKNIRSTKQGLDILSRQIEIYNRFNKMKIVQTVTDLYDGDTPCGTRFMIEVPYGFVYQ